MENITEYKNQIFKRYNYLSKNPSSKGNKERQNLFEIIVRNYWLQEYFKQYPDEFGLQAIFLFPGQYRLTPYRYLVSYN